MPSKLQSIRHSQAPISLPLRARPAIASNKHRLRLPPALGYPLATHDNTRLEVNRYRNFCCYSKAWHCQSPLGSWNPLFKARSGRLGQSGQRRPIAVDLSHRYDQQDARDVSRSLERAKAGLSGDDLPSWRQLFATMHAKHGDEGTWVSFGLLKEKHKLHIILHETGEGLRDQIVRAGTAKDAWIQSLIEVVLRLEIFSQSWPGFNTKLIHSLLRREHFNRALTWHEALSTKFPIQPEELGGLLSEFTMDPRPQMHSTLTAIYVSSGQRNIYDHLIPFLFDSGNSQIAKAWRRKLIRNGDCPSTTRAKPFVNFLAQYYPDIPLSAEESKLLEHELVPLDGKGIRPLRQSASVQETYGDNFIAKWFASTWWPVEYVIHSIHLFGYRTIGARSLQALALREGTTESLQTRLDLLRRLRIEIAPRAYCKALIFFAQKGEDKLLDQLVHTDVHPDEFDDADTRHMIMAEAARTQDWSREELFQGVEWAVENDENPNHLNNLLRNILNQRKIGKARIVTERMDALNVKMTQANATRLLGRVFWGVGKHPTRWKRSVQRSEPDYQLDRAIQVVRQVASHRVAVPLRYWESLLYSLGRLGRFDELLQLIFEILAVYQPPNGGLVPINPSDLPNEGEKVTPRTARKPKFVQQTTSIELEQEDQLFIPADLPFKHRQHPVQKLISAALQKSIVRWGFDQTLAKAPEPQAYTKGPTSSNLRLASFDIACGVRILALLRDHGVLIDRQVICSTIPIRIALGQVARRRHQTRDIYDVDPAYVKKLVDGAWGTEILPSVRQLSQLVEKQKVDIWKRYPVLCTSTNEQPDTRHHTHCIKDEEAIEGFVDGEYDDYPEIEDT